MCQKCTKSTHIHGCVINNTYAKCEDNMMNNLCDLRGIDGHKATICFYRKVKTCLLSSDAIPQLLSTEWGGTQTVQANIVKNQK